MPFIFFRILNTFYIRKEVIPLKILETKKQTVVRFRCRRCDSKFEVTKDEFDKMDKYLFDCPICNSRRGYKLGETEVVNIMDTGSEVVNNWW